MQTARIGFTIRRDSILPTARNESESRTKIVYVKQRGNFTLTYFEHPSLFPTLYGTFIPGYEWNEEAQRWIKNMDKLPVEWTS